MAWLNLTMPNQTVKNGLKAKKIKLFQIASFCKNFKKFQSYDVPFSAPKWPISPEQKIFGTNHYYYFHLSIGHFHCAKLKKNYCNESRVERMCHFWAQNGAFATNKFFLGKLLIAFSSTYKPLSLCKIFKKLFQWIQSYEDAQFLGPKCPISPNEKFFRKPVNKSFLLFMPIYMPKIKVRY